MFVEHGVQTLLKSDFSPKFGSALFTEFADNWKFNHAMTSPHYSYANEFTESMVKVVKGLQSHLVMSLALVKIKCW